MITIHWKDGIEWLLMLQKTNCAVIRFVEYWGENTRNETIFCILKPVLDLQNVINADTAKNTNVLCKQTNSDIWYVLVKCVWCINR